MEGAKACAVDAFAAEHGLGCVRFDYSGTGSSPGRFDDATLSTWIADAAAVLEALVPGPVILVGSSMGGWIAAHLALRSPEKVAALIGIAPAPDFTDWGFDEQQRQTLVREGKYQQPDSPAGDGMTTTLDLWTSGQTLRLLGAPVEIRCPVRLIHGDSDEVVPLAVVLRLMQRLRSADVQLTLIKHGGHRLSEPHEIAAIRTLLAALLETVR
jgi:pimeloyl-ACP methyl ester carboxylesterase